MAATHVNSTVGDLVTLSGNCLDQGSEFIQYSRILSDGAVLPGFEVPTNHTLVLTDIEWTAFPGDVENHRFQSFIIYLDPPGNGAFNDIVGLFRSDAVTQFDFPGFGLGGFGGNYTNGIARHQEHLTGGIPIGAGFSFDPNATIKNVHVNFGAPKPLFCSVYLRGYLIKGKN